MLICFSCEEQISLELLPANTNLLIVESIITNQNINHVVRLTHPHSTQNEIPMPATGASIQITDGVNNYPLVEFPMGSGFYYTPRFRAVFGRVYTLLIQYNGNQYSAQDSPEPVEPLGPLNIIEFIDEFGIRKFELDLQPVGENPNYVNHFITWQFTNFCESTPLECSGRVVFYDLKTVDINEVAKPEKEEFTFPAQSIIVRTKYSVSEQYKDFLRSVLSETEWRGGVFDVERANAPTNLSSGATGFFAVSTIVSDTTFVVP